METSFSTNPLYSVIISLFSLFFSICIGNTANYSEFYPFTKSSGDPENPKMVVKLPLFQVTISRLQCIEHCMRSRDTSALNHHGSVLTRLGLINSNKAIVVQ